MGEQIQRFCLDLIKKSIAFLCFLSVIYLIYFFQFKIINSKEIIINIDKGSNMNEISLNILKESNKYEKFIYYYFLKFWNYKIDKINYGEFLIDAKSNLILITKILSNPSNVYYNFAVIDGWQEYQLNNLINNRFKKKIEIKYNEILADTYKYRSTDTIDNILAIMKKNKELYFSKKYNSDLLKEFTVNEIMVIASLVEKEGIDDNDKKIIYSVIKNRLDKKMKLQIDATTIFSLTQGKFKFPKKLSLKDLKNPNIYNTYFIHGLPPSPICYVSGKTIDIILENYKSNYLFYFYNKNLNQHIYSITFEEHKKKLKKYRENE